MRIKIILLIVMISLLTGIPLTVFAEKVVKGGTLTVCQPAEPPGLDPTANTAAAIDRIVYANIFEGLIKISPDGSYIPGLASNWEISTDGKTYTFFIRKGVKFHNDEPLDAGVVKWNLQRAQSKNSTNPHPEYFKNIKDLIIENKNTLRILLKEPDTMFIPHLAEGDAVILPMKGYEKTKSHPIGTGPFKFHKWVRGDRIEVKKFKQYWNPARPYLDGVTFRFIADPMSQMAALKTGKIDVIGYIAAPESVISLKKDKRFKIFNGATTGEVILAINNKAKPFDNLLVRRAIAHAINREDVINLAMFGFGTPIGSHWSPSTPYYVDLTKRYPYNPKKAKELLAKAGYPKGFKATIKLPAIYSYSRRSGEVIADMLSKVGIKLSIEVVDWGQWIDRIFKKKEYELTMIGHVEAWDIGIYANPDYYFQYDSPKFQKAYKNAITALSEIEKEKWFGQCQKIITDDAVNGFLFSAPSMPVMRKSIMGWWENYPSILMDCTSVWIAK